MNISTIVEYLNSFSKENNCVELAINCCKTTMIEFIKEGSDEKINGFFLDEIILEPSKQSFVFNNTKLNYSYFSFDIDICVKDNNENSIYPNGLINIALYKLILDLEFNIIDDYFILNEV